MGMEKVYTCDICRDRIDNRSDLFGVVFSGMKTFTIGGYGATDGVHICYPCARQLATHLNSVEIQKILAHNP